MKTELLSILVLMWMVGLSSASVGFKCTDARNGYTADSFTYTPNFFNVSCAGENYVTPYGDYVYTLCGNRTVKFNSSLQIEAEYETQSPGGFTRQSIETDGTYLYVMKDNMLLYQLDMNMNFIYVVNLSEGTGTYAGNHVIVHDGYVHAQSDNSKIWWLDASDVTNIFGWGSTTGYGVGYSYVDGKIVLSYNCKIATRYHNGSDIASVDLGSEFANGCTAFGSFDAPAVCGGSIYYYVCGKTGGNDNIGRIYKLDANNLSITAVSPTISYPGSCNAASVICDTSYVYASDETYQLKKYSASNLAYVSNFTYPGHNPSRYSKGGSSIFITDIGNDIAVTVISASSMGWVGNYSIGGMSFGADTPALSSHGIFYLAANDGMLYGFGNESTTTTTTTTSTSTTLISGNYTLTVIADKTSYNLNETLTAEAFKAYFKFRGIIIEGDSCRFYIDDNVFLHSDVPDFGVMNYLPGSYYFKHNWVQVRDNISAQQTWINVTCSNGAFNIKNATNVSINGFQVGANPEVEFVDRLTEGNIGDYRYLTVRFKYANGTLITNATCDLYMNDVRQAAFLGEQANHLYQMIYPYPAIGYYEYSVTCTNDGWTTNYTIQDAFNVTGFYGTTTTTTGTTLPPSQCINKCAHDKVGCPPCSNGEGCDVDSECASQYCKPDTGTCQNAPTINCGRQPSGSYTSLCHCSDTLSLEGCRTDGSEHCNGTYCVPDQCIPGASCEIDGYCCGLMLWGDENHTVTYVRERGCNGEWCIFQSSSGYSNSTTAMQIYPLSGITYYDGLNYIYLAVCEDNTNGVRITTHDIATTTRYQLLTSVKTPAISPMYLPKPFSTTKADKTATIPELCNWAGTGGKYALIQFESVYQGGNPSFENKYIRVEKQSFRVNITHSDPLQLTLTRNGTCFARPNTLSPYSQIGNTTNIAFTFNRGDYANNSGMIYVYCNSTYGEPYSLTEGGGGAWFLKALFLLILNFVVTLALNLIGIENFQWQNWYTPLVVIIVIIPLPLLYLIYRDRKGNG